MKMHLEQSEQHLITDYGPGSISVDGKAFSGSVMVGQMGIIEGWFEGEACELNMEALAPLIKHKPEIVVFGSGVNHQFPDPRLMAELSSQGIALEVMNTRAACRTYNVLVSEFRNVSAALLPL